MNNFVPKAPEDLEIRNIIDKLAAFVAKNGNEFMEMTKLKQKDNSKFSFLFGGEYNDYFNYKLATEHLILKKQQQLEQPNIAQNWQQQQFNQPPPAMSLETCNTQLSFLQKQITSLQEQLQQSEKNLNAQKEVMKIKRKIQIDESIRSSNNEKLNDLIQTTKIDLNEFNRLTNSIIDACTKEAIANGKNFVLNHNLSDKHAEAICFYLLQKVTSKDSTPEARLHIVYLINDILHHSKKGIDGLNKRIEAVIVPIFCSAIDKSDDDKYGKLNKLLEFWSKNRYFSDFTMDKMKNCSNGLKYYEDCNMREYQDTIFMIEQEFDGKISQLEQQHFDYMTHINMQINALQQHIQGLQQIKSSSNNNNMYSQGAPPLQNHQSFNTPPPSHIFPQSQIPPSPKPVPLMSINPFGGNNNNSSSSPPPQSQQNNNFPPQQMFPFNFNQPPPGFNQNQSQQHAAAASQLMNSMMQFLQNQQIPFPDLSKPPPGFGPQPPTGSLMNNPVPLMQHEIQPALKPLMSTIQDKKILPEMPYFTLPAGLMVPLIKIEDFDYRPIDPKDLKLLLPEKPSEKILKAVDLFYSMSGERNLDGWEKFGLYEFYKNKLKQRMNRVVVLAAVKPEEIVKPSKISSNNNSRNRNQSTSSSSRSSSHSRSRSRSRSRSTKRRSKRSYSRSRSRSKSPPVRKRIISFQYKRSRSRSVTPPYSYVQTQAITQKEKIDNSNKGHQLLQKMGWTGQSGLGKREQGIINPIEGGEVRDRGDMYKGVGLQSDPFEQFRKNRSQTYIQRIRERDEERESSKFKK